MIAMLPCSILFCVLALLSAGTLVADEPTTVRTNTTCIDHKDERIAIEPIEVLESKPIIRLELIPAEGRPESSFPQNLRSPHGKWGILINPAS